MAWFFGDGFDCYQQISDAYMSASYWDSGVTNQFNISSVGRFSDSRGLVTIAGSASATTGALVKSSASNDAVHHINVAYLQATGQALSGTTAVAWITLFDGTTAQCTIVFRSDGAILLTSGASSGTTLATYSGAVTATNTWFAFEMEVVINSSTGSFKVRKNGNTSDDSSTTSLNTRGGTANNYANKIAVGTNTFTGGSMLDDLLWRSDSSIAWVGYDVRCYRRLPGSDVSVQFTRSGSVVPVTPFAQNATGTITAGSARYAPFIAACAGTVGTVVLSLSAGYTGNMKCSLFNDSSGAPGTVLASATAISNPTTGNNTFTFGSPPTLVQGTKYWASFDSDTGSPGTWNLTTLAGGGTASYQNSGATSATAYASFPTATPSITTGTQCPIFTVNITPTTAANANLVADVVQDGSGGYVFDSTNGDQDLYGLQSISGTPSSILAVVTRTLAQKSDAGARNVGVQLKSGSTTSNGTSTALSTSFGWIYRTDTVDPATSAAWDATGVNNLNVGIKVTA